MLDGYGMTVKEIRKLPDAELLALAEQVEEEVARAVDERFAVRVAEGGFDALATQALQELMINQTIRMHEVIGQRDIP